MISGTVYLDRNRNGTIVSGVSFGLAAVFAKESFAAGWSVSYPGGAGPPNQSGIKGVSCPSPQLCVAVSFEGVRLGRGGPGPARHAAPARRPRRPPAASPWW